MKIAWQVHRNAMAQLNPSDKENSPIKRKTLHTKSDVFQEVAHVFSCCHVTFLFNNNKLIRACPFSHFIIYLCICALCYEYIHKKRQRIHISFYVEGFWLQFKDAPLYFHYKYYSVC